MKIGTNIKKLRELRNYTQEVMAEKLNMSQNGYSKIERDETDVSFSRLVQISQVLEVNLLDLIAFDGQKMLFNISNTHNQNGTAFFDGSHTFVQELQRMYESRITDLQKEIDRLHSLLEKTLSK
jgi:transcriptional regulator with XRE-family HTH domain